MGIVAVIAGYDVAVLLWYRGPAVYEAVYILVAACLIWMTLYGSARLVRLLDELRAAQAELAELAIGSERLRVSRDLHDLLGQSLSAVSLKGSLAIRLLGHDVVAARAEIESLTGVARDALRGIRAVTRDQHPLSLGAEAAGAAALMAAAGIRHHVDVDLPGLAPPLERALAWTVREGVANVLQHSRATTCSIVAGRREGAIYLEIINDGATTSAGGGSGLAGAAERAQALSGRASAGPVGDGRFRLRIELPEAST